MSNCDFDHRHTGKENLGGGEGKDYFARMFVLQLWDRVVKI